LGGLTGAGVGAAVGNATGDTAAGALIGTAVGALGGAAIGGGLDRVRADNVAYTEQRLHQQHATQAATIQDAVVMSQAGLSDDVIMNHLRSRGLTSPPSARDLITLKNAGVSDNVLRVMQEVASSPVGIGQVAPAVFAPPVVVQETYVAEPIPVPVPVWGPRCRYPDWHPPHRYSHRHRPGVSWGVEVRH
jgi:hypothetical protein